MGLIETEGRGCFVYSNTPQNIRVSGEGRLPGEEHLSQLGKEESLGKNDNLVRAFQCELIKTFKKYKPYIMLHVRNFIPYL